MSGVKEWEDWMLSKPIASSVSGEHDQHTSEDKEYDRKIRPNGQVYCGCERCVIIRIKRRRAFRLPRVKCEKCGQLHTSIFRLCKECREEIL